MHLPKSVSAVCMLALLLALVLSPQTSEFQHYILTLTGLREHLPSWAVSTIKIVFEKIYIII